MKCTCFVNRSPALIGLVLVEKVKFGRLTTLSLSPTTKKIVCRRRSIVSFSLYSTQDLSTTRQREKKRETNDQYVYCLVTMNVSRGPHSVLQQLSMMHNPSHEMATRRRPPSWVDTLCLAGRQQRATNPTLGFPNCRRQEHNRSICRRCSTVHHGPMQPRRTDQIHVSILHVSNSVLCHSRAR